MTETDVEMDGHFHVHTAIPGYLPEGDVGTARSWYELAALLEEEFRQADDAAYQQAEALADGGDYEAAWTSMKLAETLSAHAENFGVDCERLRVGISGRGDAVTTLRGRLQAVFTASPDEGGSVAISEYTHLYLVKCTEGENCEHVEGDE